MLFMTRRRFEDEVQKRIWENDQRRDMQEQLSNLWARTYKLEQRVEHLEYLLENRPAELSSGTCDDGFFVEAPVGDIKPL